MKGRLNIGRLILVLGCIGYWAAVCILAHPYARTDISETMRVLGAVVIGTIIAVGGAAVIVSILAALFMLPTGLRKLKDWLYDR